MDASTRVAIKISRKDSIFSSFDRLIKFKNKPKACAALVDFIKSNANDVGSTTPAMYAAKRLVRGLFATEADNQNIYFSTLCTVLLADIVTSDQVLESLRSVVENTGPSKSQILITTVFTYGALITAGRLTNVSPEEQINILVKLLETSNSKHAVKRAASVFLVEAVKETPKSFIKTSLIPAVRQCISSVKEYENDFVAFMAIASLKHVKHMQKLIDQYFKGRVAFLEDVTLRGDSFAPRLQEEIVKLICLEMSQSDKGKQIISLWTKVIENAKNNTAWDSYVLLFANVIVDVMPEAEGLSECLHTKLIDLIIKYLAFGRRSSIHSTCASRAKELLEKLTARVALESKKSTISLSIINRLLSHSCGLTFDRRTRTNTVQSLLGCLGPSEIQHFADGIVTMIKETTERSKTAKYSLKDVPLMFFMLTRILNNLEVKRNGELLTKYLTFAFDLAFLKGTLSADIRAKVTDSFYKAVELHNVKLEDAVIVLDNIVAHADKSLTCLLSKLTELSLIQWRNMLTANKKMETKSNDKKYVAIRVLLLQMGLLIFRDEALASSTIQELLQCYQRVKERKGVKKLTSDDSNAVIEPHWVEVTVDLLLAMLSRENKLLRQVVSSVFPSITPTLTATALQQIIDALDPASRNDVLQHVDSEDSENEENDIEAASDEDNDFDDKEEEDEEDEDIDGEEETVNDKLRMAVRSALGYSAALTDDEDADMDDMNEEEEKRLNESLSNAFRLFRPSKGAKKKQSKDDEAVMHFRIRVLDLVEIIVTNTPTVSCCIELLDPLFALLTFSIKDSHQKPLQNRLESVLKKLGAVKKFGKDIEVSCVDVSLALKKLFDIDTSGMVSVEMAPSITDCCGMLLRAAQLIPENTESTGERIEKLFAALLTRHFSQNDRKVPFSIFQHALRMLWDGNWSLSKNIMTMLIDADLKIYKKIKLVELLEIFYKNDRLHSTATDDCKRDASHFETKFVEKFAETLNNCKKTTRLVPAFYSRIISFVQLAIQSRAKYRPTCTPTPPWLVIISHQLDHLHLLSQQKARNKLFELARQHNLPIPDKVTIKENAGGIKRPTDETESSLEAESASKKLMSEVNGKHSRQKTSDRETHKLKKESKKRRNLASSEGLENVTFSGMDPSELFDEDNSLEPVLKKSKQKFEKRSKKKQTGYANEVGEAFRPLVQRLWVRLSYGVAFSYVVADTVHKTTSASHKESTKDVYDRNIVVIAAADTLIWQTLASIAVPGFTINRLCALSMYALKTSTKLRPAAARWTTTGIGLACIPFIVTPIDRGVDLILDATVRKWLQVPQHNKSPLPP